MPRMVDVEQVRPIDANEALRMIRNSKADCPHQGKEKKIWDMAHDCAVSCVEAAPIVKVTSEWDNEPLTIEELRTMNEQPVWCETLGCWGIIIIENVGQWAGIPFLLGHQGCQFEFDIESRGLVVYRMKPAEGGAG